MPSLNLSIITMLVSFGAVRTSFTQHSSARHSVATWSPRRAVTTTSVSAPLEPIPDTIPFHLGFPVSQLNSRFLLVRRPDLAKLVQDGGEKVKQSFQSLDVFDNPNDLEMQLIHILGELGTEPPLAVLHIQPNLGLILDHLPDLGIGKETTDLPLVVPLDDESFVKLRIAHLDVLDAQELAQTAEDVPAKDLEPETVRVDVGGTKTGFLALAVTPNIVESSVSMSSRFPLRSFTRAIWVSISRAIILFLRVLTG